MADPLARKFEAKPGVRAPTNLMIGLIGPSGAGKTYSALRLATGIRDVCGGEIVLLDTENGRGRHYADRFRFRHIDFAPPFGSADYLEALDVAMRRKPSVVIIDSLTHEHEGEGGMLDFYGLELQRLAGADVSPNQRIQLEAWRRPKAARRQLLAGLLRMNVHLICCFRAAERIKPPREEPASEPVEMGFTAIAGQEFVYELTLSCLLRPGARGKPTWASERPGEALSIKLPAQFGTVFAIDEALNERHGAQLAEWARGTPRSEPRSRRVRGKRSALEIPPNGVTQTETALGAAP